MSQHKRKKHESLSLAEIQARKVNDNSSLMAGAGQYGPNVKRPASAPESNMQPVEISEEKVAEDTPVLMPVFFMHGRMLRLMAMPLEFCQMGLNAWLQLLPDSGGESRKRL